MGSAVRGRSAVQSLADGIALYHLMAAHRGWAPETGRVPPYGQELSSLAFCLCPPIVRETQLHEFTKHTQLIFW